jgi:hypothetical protein
VRRTGAAALLLLLLGSAARAGAQLPSPSAAELGLGGRSAAVARGFAAVAGNPAGLGMPRLARTAWAVLPVHVGCAMGPVSCGEVAEWGDREVPEAVREGWVEQIESHGREDVRARGGVTPLAIAVGWVGFQLTTSVGGGARLNPDASEIFLFGNAGRGAEPRVFRFGGSSLDAYAVTTAAVGVGIPLDVEIGDAPGQAFAVGATLQYSAGNALYVGRDLGTFFSGEPLELWVRFPLVQTDGPALRAGDGVGLDLGFQWDAAPWSVGLAVQNVVNTFAWDVERLVFRPVTALITDDEADSDFAPRPASDAPEVLLDAVRAFGFGPRLRVGVAKALSQRTRVFGQLDARLAPSSTTDPPGELGAALEYSLEASLPLRVHASVLNGGVRVGGGAGFRIGWLTVSAAGSYRSDHDLGGPDWMLTLSKGGS